MTTYIKQIPQWTRGMVRVHCEVCGYESIPYDTNNYRQKMKAEQEHRLHLCLDPEED